MKTAPVNGDVVGQRRNWDNDPCQEIVDQLYEVRISKNTSGMVADFFQEVQSAFDSESYEKFTDITLEARWQFKSPIDCLIFINAILTKSWQYCVLERRHYGMSADSFEEITTDDLECIINGERRPVTKLVAPVNRNFCSSVDIGD